MRDNYCDQRWIPERLWFISEKQYSLISSKPFPSIGEYWGGPFFKTLPLTQKVKVTEDEFVRFFNNIDEDGNEEIEFTEFAVGFIPFLVGQVVWPH